MMFSFFLLALYAARNPCLSSSDIPAGNVTTLFATVTSFLSSSTHALSSVELLFAVRSTDQRMAVPSVVPYSLYMASNSLRKPDSLSSPDVFG